MPNNTGELPTKGEVIDLYWSYGDDYTKLDDVSRHYIDLNLHIVTLNYAIGETVSAEIEYDTENGLQQFTVSGQVNKEGEIVIKNVFEDKVIYINGEINYDSSKY